MPGVLVVPARAVAGVRVVHRGGGGPGVRRASARVVGVARLACRVAGGVRQLGMMRIADLDRRLLRLVGAVRGVLVVLAHG